MKTDELAGTLLVALIVAGVTLPWLIERLIYGPRGMNPFADIDRRREANRALWRKLDACSQTPEEPYEHGND